MNRKGQALVEFVIILPIFLLLMMSLIDIGRIVISKNKLEDIMYDVVSYYEDDYTYDAIKEKIDKDIDLKITNNNSENISIELSKNVEIITPGLNLLLDNPHIVSAKKVISYE